MERTLAVLVNRLVKALGDRLISVILYGSAAQGDYHGRYSDLNVFAVLSKITPDELSLVEPIFAWWCELGHPSPLLMTEEETRSSADCFAIEFSDMRERRQVLHGRDVIAGLAIDPHYYRAQLEHELRSKLLRLRQHGASVLPDRDALLKLCLESISTFCVLGRHALLLGGGGGVGFDKREIVEQLKQRVGGDFDSFDALLAVRRRDAAPQEIDPATLFRKYLESVGQLIGYVDRL